MAGRIAAGAGIVLFAVLFGFFYFLNTRGVTPAELERRCAQARPAWQSYQEDIKAQVGAGPVAEWRGEPVEAMFGTGEVRVTFALEEPWAGYAAALPVLLRTPGGAVIKGAATGDNRREYVFALPPEEPGIAWAQIRYSHANIRIVPNAEGVWRGETATAE